MRWAILGGTRRVFLSCDRREAWEDGQTSDLHSSHTDGANSTLCRSLEGGGGVHSRPVKSKAEGFLFKKIIIIKKFKKINSQHRMPAEMSN